MRDVRNVLIVGGGTAGTLLAKDIRTHHPYLDVVGFVDDVKRTRVKVVGSIDDLPRLVRRYQLNEIIIAIPSADGELIRRILLLNQRNRVTIRMVPREQRVLRDDDVRYRGVKEIEPDDFLGRPLIKRRLPTLERFYRGKTVFITGGAGSIGSEIVRQLLGMEVKTVVVFDHSESLVYALDQELKEAKVARGRYTMVLGDVANGAKLSAVMMRVKPDVVFHAAAYKHVHLMEVNADEALRVNVLGTKCAADAALASGARRFVLVSTDKVVNPQSIMGASKKLAEWYVQSLKSSNTIFSVVRFGNVINSQGSVLPLFERQIREHRYVTITDRRMKRFFMSIREAAQLVILSATRAGRGAVYVLNMGDLISMVDVARCVIRSKSLVPDEDVELQFTGRRKGEKISEDLFTKDERRRTRQTGLRNIWALQKQHIPQVEVTEAIGRLENIVRGSKGPGVVRRFLHDIFPTL